MEQLRFLFGTIGEICLVYGEERLSMSFDESLRKVEAGVGEGR